jgi:hypothetical protein
VRADAPSSELVAARRLVAVRPNTAMSIVLSKLSPVVSATGIGWLASSRKKLAIFWKPTIASTGAGRVTRLASAGETA